MLVIWHLPHYTRLVSELLTNTISMWTQKFFPSCVCSKPQLQGLLSAMPAPSGDRTRLAPPHLLLSSHLARGIYITPELDNTSQSTHTPGAGLKI